MKNNGTQLMPSGLGMRKNGSTFRLSVLLALSLATSSLTAQTITQDEFLELLSRSHPLFARERITPRLEREVQTGYLGGEDWTVSSSLNLSHEQPALAFSGPERTNSAAVNAGIERALWSTGGRLSASFTSAMAGIRPTFGFRMPLYQNTVSISYIHPLLKNGGGTLDRLQYDLKQFDIDYSEIQAAENVEDFLKRSARLFLTWAFLTEQEKITAERLKLSEEERDRVLEKRKAHLVDQADVIRAEDAVRLWKQNRVAVQSQLKALRAELAVIAHDKKLLTLTPAFDLYFIEALPSLSEDTLSVRKRSRLLRALDVRAKQLVRARGAFEETTRPDLSLVARFNTKRLNEDLGTSLQMNKPDAFIGLQFSIPLENRTARSRVAQTDLQILQLESQTDEVALTLTSALVNLNIQLKEMETMLALNREQIESAQKRTAEELNLYNQGRGDLTFVLLSRDNEQNARLTYAQNAFTYHSLMLEYRATMDQLYQEGELQ